MGRLELILIPLGLINEVVHVFGVVVRVRIILQQRRVHANVFGPHVERPLRICGEHTRLLRIKVGAGWRGGQRRSQKERVGVFVACHTRVRIYLRR